MRKILIVAAALVSGFFASAQQRTVMMDAYRAAGPGAFKVGGDWFPYPAYSDRDGWDRMFGEMKAEAIKDGEKRLDFEWWAARATDYLDFERNGSRQKMWDVNGHNSRALVDLVLAELAEGKGRFLDQIINGMFLMTERTSWVHSYHQSRQTSGRVLPDDRDHFIDLGAQEWACDIAVIWHLFHEEFDKVDPSISAAIERAMKRQIFDPYLDDSKFREMAWLGLGDNARTKFNNWTIWCNTNVMVAFLLMERDQALLDRAVGRAMASNDLYLNSSCIDGACDEGPGYWSHNAGKLRDWARLMYDASLGKFNIFGVDQIRAMGEYISRVYIGDGWAVNYSDAGARTTGTIKDVFGFGLDLGSDEMMDYALYLSVMKYGDDFATLRSMGNDDLMRTFNAMKNAPLFRERADKALAAAGGDLGKMRGDLRKSVPAVTWYPVTRHYVARNGSGWVLSAKSGNNGESHNHNDVGSSVLFIDEIPVFIDAGSATYTKDTFSKNRYKIWTMQSKWHNTPTINGADQKQGSEYSSKDSEVDAAKKIFRTDIAGAYLKEAKCRTWKREYKLNEKSLTLTDSFELEERVAPDVEHFLVRGNVYLPGDSVRGIKVKKGEVVVASWSYDKKRTLLTSVKFPKGLTPSVETKKLDDKRLVSSWGKVIQRIDFTSAADAPTKGTYKFTIKKVAY